MHTLKGWEAEPYVEDDGRPRVRLTAYGVIVAELDPGDAYLLAAQMDLASDDARSMALTGTRIGYIAEGR